MNIMIDDTKPGEAGRPTFSYSTDLRRRNSRMMHESTYWLHAKLICSKENELLEPPVISKPRSCTLHNTFHIGANMQFKIIFSCLALSAGAAAAPTADIRARNAIDCYSTCSVGCVQAGNLQGGFCSADAYILP